MKGDSVLKPKNFAKLFILLLILLIFSTLVTSCQRSKRPEPITNVDKIETETDGIQPQELSTIPDAVFLPPLGNSIELTGNFDADVDVTIEIFDLDVVSVEAFGAPIGPTLSTADGSIQINYDLGIEEKYHANWDITDSNKDDGAIVRIELRLNNAPNNAPACNAGADVNVGCIGYFDVQLWKNQGQVKKNDGNQDNIIDLTNGQTLPIKFHIKEGAANVSPIVEITSPEDNTRFTSNDEITFTATANDLEDGDLSAQITWTSNITGELATEAAATIATQLPLGTHVITASVTDSNGATSASNITVEILSPMPESWQSIDVGGTGASSYDVNTKAFTLSVSASGGVDNKATHYVYQEISGDFTAQGCIQSLNSDDPEAKAGLMLRQDNTDSSKYVYIGLMSTGTEVKYVDDTDTVQTVQGQQGISTPMCYKLEREENSVRVYESDDGLNWVLVTTIALSLVDPVHIGLAVCASEHEVQAVVDDVVVEAQGPPEVLTLELGGSVVGLDGITVTDNHSQWPLQQTTQIQIEHFDEILTEVPVFFTVRSPVYRMSFLTTDSYQDEFVEIGIPIPENVDPERLIAARILDNRLGSDGPWSRNDPPQLFWKTKRGFYDESSNLFKFTTGNDSFASLKDSDDFRERIIFVLLEAPGPIRKSSESPSVSQQQLSAQQDSPPDFVGICVTKNDDPEGFAEGKCTSDTESTAESALRDAYNVFYAGDLSPAFELSPKLEKSTKDNPEGAYPIYIVPGNYRLCSAPPGGRYLRGEKEAYVCIASALSISNYEKSVIRHELFHAIQHAYISDRQILENFFAEGTATAAELSDFNHMEAITYRDPRIIDIRLLSSDETKDYEYEAQDFWVYLGKKANIGLHEAIIPFLKEGKATTVGGIDSVIKGNGQYNFPVTDENGGISSGGLGEAYWQWAKNQAFERNISIESLGNVPSCDFPEVAVNNDGKKTVLNENEAIKELELFDLEEHFTAVDNSDLDGLAVPAAERSQNKPQPLGSLKSKVIVLTLPNVEKLFPDEEDKETYKVELLLDLDDSIKYQVYEVDTVKGISLTTGKPTPYSDTGGNCKDKKDPTSRTSYQIEIGDNKTKNYIDAKAYVILSTTAVVPLSDVTSRFNYSLKIRLIEDDTANLDDETNDGSRREYIATSQAESIVDGNDDGIADDLPKEQQITIHPTDFEGHFDTDGNTIVGDYREVEVATTSLQTQAIKVVPNIDMSDFRRLRDWLLVGEGLDSELNGSPDHPKKNIAEGSDALTYADYNDDGQLKLNEKNIFTNTDILELEDLGTNEPVGFNFATIGNNTNCS